MDFDLHIHTSRYSGCSNIDPSKLLARAREAGLEGIAIAEHGIRWPDAEIEELVRLSGVPDLVVLPGQEIACYSRKGKFQGEFLVFGFPESLGSNTPVEDLIPLVHSKGGVVVAAHPFKKADTGEGFYGSGPAVMDLQVDGLETEHPDYDERGRRMAAEAMMTMKVAGIGCSDAHDLRLVGICRSVFERPVRDVPALCAEIRARRVRAVNRKAAPGNGR